MSTNKFYTKKSVTTTNITVLLILLYIILFEFILVAQTVIPKPSLIFASFLSLLSEYNLLSAFFETTAVIFPALLFAIVILEIFAKFLFGTFLKFDGLFNVFATFKYFSFFFVSLLLNFLFPQSIVALLFFAILFLLFKLSKILFDGANSINEEYVLTAKSLGLSKKQIFSQIIWKSLKPKVYTKLTSIHTELWVVVLIYEFIGSTIGIGAIYRMAYSFNDLLAIISLGVFISLVILIVNQILELVVSKIIFWK